MTTTDNNPMHPHALNRTDEKYGSYYVWSYRDIRWCRVQDTLDPYWWLWLVDDNGNQIGDCEWVFDNPAHDLDQSLRMMDSWREDKKA